MNQVPAIMFSYKKKTQQKNPVDKTLPHTRLIEKFQFQGEKRKVFQMKTQHGQQLFPTGKFSTTKKKNKPTKTQQSQKLLRRTFWTSHTLKTLFHFYIWKKACRNTETTQLYQLCNTNNRSIKEPNTNVPWMKVTQVFPNNKLHWEYRQENIFKKYKSYCKMGD